MGLLAKYALQHTPVNQKFVAWSFCNAVGVPVDGAELGSNSTNYLEPTTMEMGC